jgi:predicted TIM-barrel fold metal-dependent hydrolase
MVEQVTYDTLTLEGRPESLFKPVKHARKQARLVTLEEHAVTPFPVPATSVTFATFEASFLKGLKARLGDIDLRLKIMDANNIGAQIISLNQPTAQAFVRVEEALDFCKQANKFVYENYVVKHPKRFFAFATLPTQDGTTAAQELERCVKDYGFVGAMINGYANTADPEKGLYLDHPQFDALWEVAQRLETPIFIHPRVPLASNLRVLEDMPTLHGAPYGFARETVEHVFRLMYNGVFDRFPNLKICLGHMGEGLSWILPRADTTFRMYSAGVYSHSQAGYQSDIGLSMALSK